MSNHNLIWDFFNVIATAGNIKRDEYQREKSVRFGVMGIVFSIIAIPISVAAVVLFIVIL